jgi:hypothetical protein
MTEYISKQRAKDLMGCCLASAKANLKVETSIFKKAEFESIIKTVESMIDVVGAVEAADVQPVKRGRWITKAEDYYKAWQDSGRSWDDMPYFVTGLKFACSNCFEQFDVNAEGVEKWNGCPLCLARMDGEQNENN